MAPARKLGYPVMDIAGSAINPLPATAEPISKMCDSPGKTHLTKGENARKTEKEKSLNSIKQKKNPNPNPQNQNKQKTTNQKTSVANLWEYLSEMKEEEEMFCGSIVEKNISCRI